MPEPLAIKIMLLERGVSQAAISEASGADRSVVNKVIAGKLTSGRMATKAAKVLARKLKVPVRQLFPWVAA